MLDLPFDCAMSPTHLFLLCDLPLSPAYRPPNFSAPVAALPLSTLHCHIWPAADLEMFCFIRTLTLHPKPSTPSYCWLPLLAIIGPADDLWQLLQDPVLCAHHTPESLFDPKCSGVTSSFLLIYLLLAVLGPRCCARAFSSCGERGLLFGLRIAVASLVGEHGL